MTTYTEYDLDCLEELQWVVSRTIDSSVARREWITALVWTVCAFLCSFLALRASLHPAVVAFLFVAGLFLGRKVLNVYRAMAKKSWNSMDRSVVRNDYTLDKSGITAENSSGSARYPYSHCFRLLETRSRFYVILKEGQGIVLDKGHIGGGSADEMRTLLETRCGMKFEFLTYRRLLPGIRLPGSGSSRL